MGEIKCLECQRWSTPVSSKQVFCSDRCRDKFIAREVDAAMEKIFSREDDTDPLIKQLNRQESVK